MPQDPLISRPLTASRTGDALLAPCPRLAFLTLGTLGPFGAGRTGFATDHFGWDRSNDGSLALCLELRSQCLDAARQRLHRGTQIGDRGRVRRPVCLAAGLVVVYADGEY